MIIYKVSNIFAKGDYGMNDALLKILEKTPLEELGPVFEILARRVYNHRKQNNGYVPLSIFPFCVGLGGVYPCVEIVVIDSENGLPMVKKRNSKSEHGYQNEFQVPGVTARITDGPIDVLNRAFRELFGLDLQFDYCDFPNLEMVGIEIHDEPYRRATCWTLVYKYFLPSGLRKVLVGEWKYVHPPYDDPEVVDHHRATLSWACTPKDGRPFFVALR